MMKYKVFALLAAVSILLSACGKEAAAAGPVPETESAEVTETVREQDTAPAETSLPPAQEEAEEPGEPQQPAEADTEEDVVPPDLAAPAEAAASEIVPFDVEAPAAAAPAAQAPAPAPAPSLAYGGVPFNLAAGTDRWWYIDSSDSAYWAVQENINAIRAAAGLAPLSMDSGLSAIASARCESFVAGGAFDHSGMVTASEICASGPIGSASAVCAAWQASPAHYAAMTGNFSSMGVGCWFCSTDQGNYTYWCVTFG